MKEKTFVSMAKNTHLNKASTKIQRYLSNPDVIKTFLTGKYLLQLDFIVRILSLPSALRIHSIQINSMQIIFRHNLRQKSFDFVNLKMATFFNIEQNRSERLPLALWGLRGSFS